MEGGLGVQKDPEAAVFWSRAAPRQGSGVSCELDKPTVRHDPSMEAGVRPSGREQRAISINIRPTLPKTGANLTDLTGVKSVIFVVTHVLDSAAVGRWSSSSCAAVCAFLGNLGLMGTLRPPSLSL